jgi:hypothetical protein
MIRTDMTILRIWSGGLIPRFLDGTLVDAASCLSVNHVVCQPDRSCRVPAIRPELQAVIRERAPRTPASHYSF